MFKKYFVNPFTVFFSTTLVFFWPISLFFFSLKNDALTYYYPVRTLISDALHNGELPLWTPFINMGYPLHADMQSGAWNPIIWLFSFLGNYSLAAFHYELLFYIAYAGIGFYLLCRQLGCSKMAAYSIAIAYQFSGFNIDSVQFFNCMSAACYLPWIILCFRKMIVRKTLPATLGLAFYLFLLFTGGYPSLFIITFYVLVAYTLFTFFSDKNKVDFLKRFVPLLLISAVFFTLLSLPALVSFIQHLPFISRGKGQPLSFVLENSMNPATALSLFIPFATTANEGWLHSQVIMRSIYMGIIPLLFTWYAFTKKELRENRELIFFFVMAIIMLGMAWGEFFFLRQMAYYVLPLMDSFRHPALFRLFSIFFLLLIAASALKEWEINKDTNLYFFKKMVPALLVLVSVSSIVAGIFQFTKNGFNFLHFSNLKNAFPLLDFQQRFLIQSPFLLTTLLLAWLVIVQKKNTQLLCLLSIFDLFFATQLNLPVTVMGAKEFTQVKMFVNRNPEKFPLPGIETLEENSRNSSGEAVITGSTLPFTKKIGRNDYYITPGNLSLQDSFYESGIRDSILKNPVLYFTETGDLKNDRPILMQSLSANTMKTNIETNQGGMLTYLQNYYPGWEAFVDGKERSLKVVNISFMGIAIPAGKHEIELRYRPGKVIYAWYVSLISFIIMLLWLTVILFQKNDQRNAYRKIKIFHKE